MIVPAYWAKSRIQEKLGQRKATVRRFGWSDTSLAEAQANANQRARDAFARLACGEKIQRREPRLAYNGTDGVPIREKIISRHGPTIITRNSYDARSLNTPDVLFADIDFGDRSPTRLTLGFMAVLPIR